MQRPVYTDEQRAEALALLAVAGQTEASRRTGIPAGTIASWGHRHGVTAPPVDTRHAGIAAAQASWAERRATLANDLGHVVDKGVALLLARINDGTIRDAPLVTAIGALIDRAQLLSGDVTARTEMMQADRPQVDTRALADELEKRRRAKDAA